MPSRSGENGYPCPGHSGGREGVSSKAAVVRWLVAQSVKRLILAFGSGCEMEPWVGPHGRL